jgi:hypothetical protein
MVSHFLISYKILSWLRWLLLRLLLLWLWLWLWIIWCFRCGWCSGDEVNGDSCFFDCMINKILKSLRGEVSISCLPPNTNLCLSTGTLVLFSTNFLKSETEIYMNVDIRWVRC